MSILRFIVQFSSELPCHTLFVHFLSMCIGLVSIKHKDYDENYYNKKYSTIEEEREKTIWIIRNIIFFRFDSLLICSWLFENLFDATMCSVFHRQLFVLWFALSVTVGINWVKTLLVGNSNKTANCIQFLVLALKMFCVYTQTHTYTRPSSHSA